MKARLFILDGSASDADQNFDEVLRRTFKNVMTDNGAIQHFTSLKDATVSIGKAFSDSDTVIFFADASKFADTKDILCKALGMNLIVDEMMLSVALKNATDTDLDSAYFNICHAGVVEYLTFARNYAREREMTLTDLVVGYFKRLKESLSVKNQLPPSVSEMVGIIPSDKDNPIDEYHDHLVERYA